MNVPRYLSIGFTDGNKEALMYYKTSLWLLDWSVLISDFLAGLAPLIGAHCDRPTS